MTIRPALPLVFSILTSLGTLAVAAEPAATTWVGQKVLARKAGSLLSTAAGPDKPAAIPVKHIVYTCVAEEGHRIRVNYPGQEGWANQEDWVRLDAALDYFTARTKAEPGDAFAWSRRGMAHRYAGKPELALNDLKEAVRLAPMNSDIVGIRGMMWWANKDLDRAIADYTEAVRLDPQYAVGFRNRAMAWQAKGDLEKALADYAEAAKAAPHYAPTFHERAAVWRAKGEYRKALADLEQAVRLDPRYAVAFADQARLLATCKDDTLRDGKRALVLATKAHELNAKDAAILEALALAHAEAGDFAKAVAFETKALADKAFEAGQGAAARERLKQFEAKKPWRE